MGDEPMDIAMRLLKDDDPLDEEFNCPKCSGAGGFDEGGEENPDDYVTCDNCRGSGSIEPTHHPGKDNQGAVSATVFDIREGQHRKDYDVEGAMPYGNKQIQTGQGELLDPMRAGFPRDARMKQTRYPISPQSTIANTNPAEQHRLPSVYTREWDGEPSNAGLPMNQGDFKRSEPMDIAWQLLKEMRQSTLGEYHPWWPSPHGEADWFHGTSTDHAKNINEKGLLPGKRQAGTGRGDYVEEGIVPTEENTLDESVPAAAFISPNLEDANMHSFFAQNALNAQGSTGTKGMVGVRSRGLAEAIERGDTNPLTGKPLEVVSLADSNRINEGAMGIAGGVPRQYITPVQPGVIHGQSPKDQAMYSNPIESRGESPFYQGMPLDWSGYDRSNQENQATYGQWG